MAIEMVHGDMNHKTCVKITKQSIQNCQHSQLMGKTILS